MFLPHSPTLAHPTLLDTELSVGWVDQRVGLGRGSEMTDVRNPSVTFPVLATPLLTLGRDCQPRKLNLFVGGCVKA